MRTGRTGLRLELCWLPR